ncbi:hypothetical protein [Peribacillus asahii]|uniref:hypothetical protein n=1 Tax=Peribacillus asahii TaxID=228899 RepID=UPI0038297887
MEPEIHLYILWENCKSDWDKILYDIKEKFKVIKVFQVQWTQNYFLKNLERFYGINPQIANQKVKHCGNGPFLLIIVEDQTPKYEKRKTSKGVQSVNINTFDAKRLYRSWTGGGHRIHGTNSPKEANHDLALLLETDSDSFQTKNKNSWDGNVETLNRDLIGAKGWESLSQLLFVLNHTVNYVILRNYDCIPEKYTMASHGDIDILTDNYKEFVLLTNAVKVFPQSYRIHHKINIAGENVFFDFRHVGDGYYDKNWEKDILNNKKYHKKKFYIPNTEDFFYSLMYHALIHKRKVANDYKRRLSTLATEMNLPNISKQTFDNSLQMKIILDQYMNQKNYRYIKPIDSSVFYNQKLLGEDQK